MNSKLKSSIIYIACLGILTLLFLLRTKQGGVCRTDENASYLYLPMEYTSNVWVSFNEIRSENCDGAEIVYYKNGGTFMENQKESNGENAYYAAASLSELKNNLYAGYNSEGKLSTAVYCAPCHDKDKELYGFDRIAYYLLFRFQDTEGQRYEDILNMCGQSFAQNTVSTLQYKNSSEPIARLLVTYEYNSVDKNHIEIYFSSQTVPPDELNTSPEKFKKLRLFHFDGIDSFTLAKAFNQSSDEDPAAATRKIAETTAHILSEDFMDELKESLLLTDDFEIIVCEGKADELS